MAKRKTRERPNCEHVPDTEQTLGAWTMVPDPNEPAPARGDGENDSQNGG